MSIEITYFAHGTTYDNEKHLASGQADAELSKLGVSQAKKLGGLVKNNFDFIFVSDLSRSIDTAKIAFGKDIKLIIDPRLRECDYGDLTQKVKDWSLLERFNNKYPNGESYLDVEKRIKEFINFLKEKYSNKKIAIVSHQAPQFAFEVITNDFSWKEVIENDWRKQGKWQPGWKYILK